MANRKGDGKTPARRKQSAETTAAAEGMLAVALFGPDNPQAAAYLKGRAEPAPPEVERQDILKFPAD